MLQGLIITLHVIISGNSILPASTVSSDSDISSISNVQVINWLLSIGYYAHPPPYSQLFLSALPSSYFNLSTRWEGNS